MEYTNNFNDDANQWGNIGQWMNTVNNLVSQVNQQQQHNFHLQQQNTRNQYTISQLQAELDECKQNRGKPTTADKTTQTGVERKFEWTEYKDRKLYAGTVFAEEIIKYINQENRKSRQGSHHK